MEGQKTLAENREQPAEVKGTKRVAPKAVARPKAAPVKSEPPAQQPIPGSSTNPAPKRPATSKPRTKRPTAAMAPIELDERRIDQAEPERLHKPPMSQSEALALLADRANGGDREALAEMRQMMDRSPEIWQHLGDLGQHSELALIDRISCENCLMVESVKRFVAHMKNDLAGPAPSAIERLMVQQVALTWLGSRNAELDLAKPGPVSLGEAKLRHKRAESAQRLYSQAFQALIDLRRYAPTGSK